MSLLSKASFQPLNFDDRFLHKITLLNILSSLPRGSVDLTYLEASKLAAKSDERQVSSIILYILWKIKLMIY